MIAVQKALRFAVACVVFSSGPLVVVACSSAEVRPPPATDPVPTAPTTPTPRPDAGSGDGGGGGTDPSGCVKGEQLGTTVKQVVVAGDVPEATGGAITPGTWVLTKMSAYNPNVAPGTETSLQGAYTLVISATDMVIVGDAVVGQPKPEQLSQSQTQQYQATGNSLAFVLDCPPTAAFPARLFYSATATQLTLHKNAIELEFYTKR